MMFRRKFEAFFIVEIAMHNTMNSGVRHHSSTNHSTKMMSEFSQHVEDKWNIGSMNIVASNSNHREA